MSIESFPIGVPKKETRLPLTESERTDIVKQIEVSEQRRNENGIPMSEERKELYNRTREQLKKKIILLMLVAGPGIGAIAEKMDTTTERIEQSPELSAQYKVLESELLEACFLTSPQACHQAVDDMDNFFERNKLNNQGRKIALKAMKTVVPLWFWGK